MIDKAAWYARLGYDPGAGQRAFHESDARIKVACCARRAGKSFCAARDVEPLILMPDTRGWIVGPHYELAEKEFRYIWDDLVIQGPRLGVPKPLNKKYDPRAGDMWIRFPWGSEVRAKSADKPSGLLGEELDWVIMAEAAQINNDVYERYVDPTLRVRRGRTIISTTPQMGSEWVWKYYELGMQSNEVGVDAFNWSVLENPNYPPEEFENAKMLVEKGVMSEEAFREQFLGEWVLYTGAVFRAFKPSVHVVKPFDIPPEWKRYRAIDFGARDPFCCLWATVSPLDGTVYLYREYYETGEPSTKEHAERILDWSKDEQYGFTVADKSGAQLRIDLAGYGIPTIPSDSGPNTRAQMRARISEFLTINPDTQRSGLYVFDTCLNLIRELKLLRWGERSGLESQKERTVGDDHAVDPLGYLLQRLPKPRAPKRTVVPFNSFAWWKRTIERQKRRERVMGAGL